MLERKLFRVIHHSQTYIVSIIVGSGIYVDGKCRDQIFIFVAKLGIQSSSWSEF